jgi:uncharacterized protein YcbK (DUF882 family)
MKLSKHFDDSEFECKCGKCQLPEISKELLEILEKVREHFGKPIQINSGYRCPDHNAKIGGSPRSQHCKGTAADIVIKGVLANKVADYIDMIMPNKGGIGRYSSFSHVDVRPVKARWKG